MPGSSSGGFGVRLPSFVLLRLTWRRRRRRRRLPASLRLQKMKRVHAGWILKIRPLFTVNSLRKWMENEDGYTKFASLCFYGKRPLIWSVTRYPAVRLGNRKRRVCVRERERKRTIAISRRAGLVVNNVFEVLININVPNDGVSPHSTRWTLNFSKWVFRRHILKIDLLRDESLETFSRQFDNSISLNVVKYRRFRLNAFEQKPLLQAAV